jgi:non-ribosomal peptide synthetase component F
MAETGGLITGDCIADNYWDAFLREELPDVSIPADYDRRPVPSFLREEVRISLNGRFASNLDELCAREDSSPFVVLLAALNVLIHRYTGQEDLIVGSVSSDCEPEAGDDRQERFSNVVPLRTSVRGNESSRMLLRRLSRVVKSAAGHRSVPFDRILRKVDPSFVSNRAPFCQVMLVYLGATGGISSAPVSVRDLDAVAEHTVRSDLVLIVREDDEGFRVTCNYDAELFKPARMERLLGHYVKLLDGILSDPARRVSEQPL